MPIQGLTRLRFNQLAKQTVIGTAVAATRRVPWRGAIVYDPNRTDPDVDVGSLDPILLPYPTAADVSWNPTGPLDFDSAPIRLSAGLMGGIVPAGSGTSRTWTFQVASLTADAFDYYTDQFGDDTSATDTIIANGGVIDTMEETLPEDGGPWTISDQWIFAGATLGSAATGGININASPVWVFGTDTTVYKDTTAASIGTSPLTDGVHGVTIRVNNNLDKKRFQNGSNTRFQLSGYGRGQRVIELVLTLAKTTATIAEANTLDDNPVPNRFFKVATSSTELAAAATPYLYERRGAFRLFRGSEGEIAGNATIVLTYHAYYDSPLGYSYRANVTDTLLALP